MSRFFIYSLPRSGSAWLSVFLSGKDSYCYHEPFADTSASGVVARMDLRSEKNVGFIDTSAYQRDDVNLIEAKRFVLIRPYSDIQASVRALGWAGDFDKEFDKFRKVTLGLTPIYFTRLFDLKYLRQVWTQVVGDGWDIERAEFLVEMNIQRDIKAIKRRYAAAYS